MSTILNENETWPSYTGSMNIAHRPLLNWQHPSKPAPDHKRYSLLLPDGPLKESLPVKVDLRSGFPAIFDQKSLGSCTAQAWCALLDFMELFDLKDGLSDAEIFELGKFDPISRLFFYWAERSVLHSVNSDSGAELSTGAEVVESIGFCRESMWPYKISKFKMTPPVAAKVEASLHRDRRPYSLDATHLKNCLAAGFPFVGGITVYDSMESEDVAESGLIPMPQKGDKEAGGHAICIGGYDDSIKIFPESKGSYLLRNSWGVDWGQKGWAWIPQEFIENSELSSDFWTLRLGSPANAPSKLALDRLRHRLR